MGRQTLFTPIFMQQPHFDATKLLFVNIDKYNKRHGNVQKEYSFTLAII